MDVNRTVFFGFVLLGSILTLPNKLTAQSRADSICLADDLYQEGILIYGSGNYASAISLFDSIEQIYIALDTSTLEQADARYMTGLTSRLHKNYPYSLECYDRAIEIYLSIDPKYKVLLECYMQKAHTFRYIGDFKKAGFEYLNGAETARFIYSSDLSKQVETLSLIGSTLSVIGNNEAANNLLDEVESICLKQGWRTHAALVNVYNYRGIDKKNRGYYLEALANYKQVEDILKANKAVDERMQSLMNTNIGIAYKNMNQADSAIVYYQKSIDECRTKKQNTPVTLIRNLMNISRMQAKVGMKDVAKANMDEGIALALDFYGEVNIRYLDYCLIREDVYRTIGERGFLAYEHKRFDSLRNAASPNSDGINYQYVREKARCFRAIGNYKMAEEFFVESLDRLENLRKNAQDLNEYTLEFRSTIFEYADQLYEAYNKEGDVSQLKKSSEYFRQAIQSLIEDRKNASYENSNRHFLARHAMQLSHAVDVNFKLYALTNQDSFFQKNIIISQLSKGIKLEAKINTSKGIEFADIDLKDITKRSFIEEQIERINTKRSQTDISDSLSVVLGDSLIALRKDITQWYLDIEKKYPKYYNFKYGHWDKTISDLRKSMIGRNNLYLDYLVLDDECYVLAISSDTLSMRKIDSYQNLKIDLDNLFESTNDVLDLNRYNQKLYDQLLGPELVIHSDSITEIVISPDEKIAQLSFELLKSADNYLIENYNIRYIHSLNVNYSAKSQARKLMALFVPEYKEELNLPENNLFAMLVREGHWRLPGAESESMKINAMIGGDLFVGENATKEKFINVAQEFKLLHLSMHSVIQDGDDENSGLIFQNTGGDTNFILNHEELYALNLQADLVVLSACNTGVGKYEKGDGVMSLSHGFSCAGVPSSVMSYWKVPDQSTSEIMVAFYKYLKEGRTKSESLRQAKLDYLNNAQSESLRHPIYWAGFVLIGNDDAVDFSVASFNKWWGLFGIILFGLMLTFIIYRRRLNS